MLSLHRLLQLSLLAGLLLLTSPTFAFDSTDSALEESDVEAPQGRRQLWDFFTLLAFVGGGHCPPGPLGKKCKESQQGGYYMDEADYKYDSDGSYNGGYDADYAVSENYEAASGGYNAAGSSNGGTSQYEEKNTAGGGAFSAGSSAFRIWMVFFVASVVSTVVAVHMGQRKNPIGRNGTNMKGAVARRNGAVSAFATGAFARKKKPEEVELKTQGSDDSSRYENVV